MLRAGSLIAALDLPMLRQFTLIYFELPIKFVLEKDLIE